MKKHLYKSWPKCFLITVFILLVCVVVGCSHTRGTKIDSEKLSQIKEGTTTKSQVESLLGPPNMTQMIGGKVTYQYNYSRTSQGINVLRGADIENQVVSVTFNENNVVEIMQVMGGKY